MQITEKEITGQMELVRYMADRVRQELVRFNSHQPPATSPDLQRITRGVRNFANEIESLQGMINKKT